MEFTTVRVPIEVRNKAEELKSVLEKKIKEEIGISINLSTSFTPFLFRFQVHSSGKQIWLQI